MANRSKKNGGAARSNVIIDIRGGRNQIFPNVTTMVQNFYGAEFAPGNKRMRSSLPRMLPSRVTSPTGANGPSLP